MDVFSHGLYGGFDGISWASQPFFTINWIVLLLLYGYLFYRYKRRKLLLKK